MYHVPQGIKYSKVARFQHVCIKIADFFGGPSWNKFGLFSETINNSNKDF